jgi:hypothetical protein
MQTAKTVLASSVFLGMAYGSAHAEICYRVSPFPDVIRVAQTTFQDEAAGGTHILVVGNWTFGSAYSLPLVGSLDVSVTPPGIRIGLHGTNHTTAFGNHSDCTFDQAIPGPTGSLMGSCDGRVAGIFNGPPATLTEIPCDTLSTAPVQGGKAYGQ